MSTRVFDDIVRTDGRPARYGEGRFEFLNRSASLYFGLVRDLIEEWFSHVPSQHQPGLRLPQRGIEPTPWLYQETSVCTDGDDVKADLIHVRHEHDVFRAAPKGHPQIALGVRMRLRPRREQGVNGLAYRPLNATHARTGDEVTE